MDMTKKKNTVAKKQNNLPVQKEEEKLAPATLTEVSAALLVHNYGKLSFGDEVTSFPKMLDLMKAEGKRVRNDDISEAESMLIMQAQALQVMFTRLASHAISQTHAPHFDMYMKFALRTQNQCRMTLETLANIKNPPIVYARQANIAQGHQQVNNGVPVEATHARAEKTIETNELLEVQDGERLDTRTQGTPGRTDTTLEAVETGRGKNTRRKSA